MNVGPADGHAGGCEERNMRNGKKTEAGPCATPEGRQSGFEILKNVDVNVDMIKRRELNPELKVKSCCRPGPAVGGERGRKARLQWHATITTKPNRSASDLSDGRCRHTYLPSLFTTMADLTVLSPHPLITLSYYSDQRVAAITDPSDDVSLAEEESAQEQEAEPSSDVVHESPSAQSQSQADTSLLCPPSPNVRRRQKRLRSLSPDGSEVTRQRLGDEFTGDSNEAPELVVPSYTRSFHPFNYPSSPNLALLSATSRGNLARPDPPLCECLSSSVLRRKELIRRLPVRPKTFWRHTKRSAVTAPSYSPSSYLVRRSTFIAAGLSLDKPHADLSALSVELRVGTLTLVPSTALLV